ncbi:MULTISPECIES: hypothetical protein [Arthrobacter]|uniref:Uncharacterized protein n=1 Tax=Arthrobacter terricola TaxID=2547396 RepID=A0A4R5KC52_9MICC|nr:MULTISPECIES: hypothetical protein [Arthrobacter]MBT8162595.1 hypothetical protein [Arthrobacter sp. GN70]TDF92849.1 hypothetical protein E1809_16955 [Arthrobacter terricola]
MGNSREPTITVSEPQPAVLALYLRDVAGLPVAPEIPPLSPRVSTSKVGVLVDIDEASAEWDRWWGELMMDEERHRPGAAFDSSGQPVPSRFPVLGQLMSQVETAALAYSSERKREAAELRRERILNRVQFQILSEARPALLKWRRAREVSLRVTQLPVGGEFRQSRSEHHVVVSLNTYSDPHAYDAALRDALGWRR